MLPQILDLDARHISRIPFITGLIPTGGHPGCSNFWFQSNPFTANPFRLSNDTALSGAFLPGFIPIQKKVDYLYVHMGC